MNIEQIKQRIAKWLGYGYSERDIRWAYTDGRLDAASTATGIATNKLAHLFHEAAGRSREVFDTKEMEFRIPIENFANFQIDVEKELTYDSQR